MVTPHDAVVFFVELVIVSFQLVDRNKSFAFGVIQFHVETPLRYTGDRSYEILAQFVAHELDLLILDGSSLCIGGDLFHVGAMFTHLLVLLGIGRASAVKVTLQ